MRRRHVGLLAVVSAVLIALVPGVAHADTVTNNLTVGGNDTTTVGSTTTVGFTLNATRDSTDPGNSAQCNAKTNQPVSVTVAIAVPSGTTATVTPSTFSFTDCGTA